MQPPSVRPLIALWICCSVGSGCAGNQVEPDAPRTAIQRQPEPQPEKPELTEVREFRESIADRQALLERTAASTVGAALVSVAEDFYQQHREKLHESFDTSLGELQDASPPDPTVARLVGSVDAATPEENGERLQLAQFHLVFSPDVRQQATNAFNAAFVPLASSQVEMPVTRAGELYGFFSVAQPAFSRCGDNEVCIHYGQSDTFIVSFDRLEQGLWTPSAVAWWTTVPPPPPEEGVGQKQPPGGLDEKGATRMKSSSPQGQAPTSAPKQTSSVPPPSQGEKAAATRKKSAPAAEAPPDPPPK